MITLFAFIERHRATASMFKNSYVTHPGFNELYVRYTMRAFQSRVFAPVLDIARVEAEKPGSGAFTKLVTNLRETYPDLHLFVEQVLNERFVKKLVALGFKACDPNVSGISFFLQATEKCDSSC